MIIGVSSLLIIFLFGSAEPIGIADISSAIVKADNGLVLGAIEESGTEEKEADEEILKEKIQEPKINENVSSLSLFLASVAAIDLTTGMVLFDSEAEREMPIASITKLATVFTFLDHNPGWEEIYTVRSEDITSGGRIYLAPGDKVRIRDLFNLSLVCSSNTAAKALVNSTGLGEADFVIAMNEKARELGLGKTEFVEPTGLHSLNVASARELALFAAEALTNEEISAATLMKQYEFETVGGRKISVLNTDSLLKSFPQNGVKILGGKTGYTKLAGYCFTGRFAGKGGHEIITVVLQSPTRQTSFSETKKLANWVFESYTWE